MYPTTLRHAYAPSLDEARAIFRACGVAHHDVNPTGARPKHVNGHGKRGAVVKSLAALGLGIEGRRIVDADGRAWGTLTPFEGGVVFSLDYILSA